MTRAIDPRQFLHSAFAMLISLWLAISRTFQPWQTNPSNPAFFSGGGNGYEVNVQR